ncbi:MAG: hypothetical protein RBT19_13545 [Tenuifilaceae bacterium]|jgi:hypothetical protein|nr:hypothetical protein [Tenuifilaceae bacterium]
MEWDAKELGEKARNIRDNLKVNDDIDFNRIDINLDVVKPYLGSDVIKIIVIGQDPTIKNEKTRKNITCTLNLDKENSLKRYISDICTNLGLTIENVYATNLFKYFYTIPPAQTMDVLYAHLEPNLELLKEELSQYKGIPIITLGEPVLQLLTHPKAKVREYWDYNPKTGESNGNFTYSKANENKLGRDLYPFPHQPSIRKMFYGGTIDKYIRIVK